MEDHIKARLAIIKQALKITAASLLNVIPIANTLFTNNVLLTRVQQKTEKAAFDA